MPQNDFLPIATAGGANVQAQGDYAASSLQEVGFPVGAVPPSSVWNKMLRQASQIASAIAQAICDITGLDMLDAGVAATLIANFKALLQQSAGVTNYAVDTGAANAYVAAFAPVITAHLPGVPLRVKVIHGNTAASTFNDGAGVLPLNRPSGRQLNPGDLSVNGIYTFICNAAGTAFEVSELAGADANPAVRHPALVIVPNTNVLTGILPGLANGSADGIVVVESRFNDAFPGTNFIDVIIVLGSQNVVVLGTNNNAGGGSPGVRTYDSAAGLTMAITGAVADAPVNVMVYGSGFSV